MQSKCNKLQNNKKIYVRNIPNGTPRLVVVKYFSQFGNVKTSWVKNPTYGFVEFRSVEGLRAALACTTHVLNGVRINVTPYSFTARKGRTERVKKHPRGLLATPPPVDTNECEKGRGFKLFIRNLVSPNRKKKQIVWSYFSQFGVVSYLFLKKGSTFGFVVFRDKEGMEAATAITSHVLEGTKIHLTPDSEVCTARLYIPTIPPPICHEELIKNTMEKFGTIINLHTTIKYQAGQISNGFCTVTFSTQKEALRVLETGKVVLQGNILQVFPFGWTMGRDESKSQEEEEREMKERQMTEGKEELVVRKEKRKLRDTQDCDGMEGHTTRTNKRRYNGSVVNNNNNNTHSDDNLPQQQQQQQQPSSLLPTPPPPSSPSAYKRYNQLPIEHRTFPPNYFVEVRTKVSSVFSSQVGTRPYTSGRRKRIQCSVS
ncbi:hypothetical protein Pmani_007765 [Petrolisthes manimaculis]|uniref:RRM domain-containing protein n=1 Tax=Petrolisthes manimaculis TaxID=1843537 RepID=A0AAE1UID0_9EUCA|nr:hypothetical protein Pmani_007765 [Petrolisthes manimaculis]